MAYFASISIWFEYGMRCGITSTSTSIIVLVCLKVFFLPRYKKAFCNMNIEHKVYITRCTKAQKHHMLD